MGDLPSIALNRGWAYNTTWAYNAYLQYMYSGIVMVHVWLLYARVLSPTGISQLAVASYTEDSYGVVQRVSTCIPYSGYFSRGANFRSIRC